MENSINFEQLANDLLARSESVVASLLPAGYRDGNEWVCGDLSGNAGESCKVNLRTGKWADFSAGESGGDLISLAAAIWRCSQLEAAKRLSHGGTLEAAKGDGRPAPVKKQTVQKEKQFTPVWPVPVENIPEDFGIIQHPKHGTASRHWVYRDLSGGVINVVYRYDTAKGKEIVPYSFGAMDKASPAWYWKQIPDNRPLYNLQSLAQWPSDKKVVLVEGEKAADAAQSLLAQSVLTWPGGGKAIRRVDWSPLKGRDVLLISDADEAGHDTMQKLSEILLPIAKSVQVALMPDVEGVKGWDAADAVADGWDRARYLAAVKPYVKTVEPMPDKSITVDANKECEIPEGFAVIKNQIYWAEGNEPIWISSWIDVLTYTRDEENRNWGRLIRFADQDRHIHERAVPMEIFGGDCNEFFRLLLSSGVQMTTSRKFRLKLAEYIQQCRTKKRAFCVQRVGWHKDHFILPNGAIPSTDTVYLQSDYHGFAGYRCAGTLQEWQTQVAVPCQGNSRLVFALACALSAPLLPFLHVESGGFNLKGQSSGGKTSALTVAASVWGLPAKYIEPWRSTGNALEAVAEAHNHTLLCLDELGQVSGHEAGEIAYMLANGCGKSRMQASGALRQKKQWELIFLSTGEISISDKMGEVGKKAQAGMLTRMVDIPADAGKGHRLFDTVHGFESGGALANHLQQATATYYGTAIREFILHVIGIRDQLSQAVEQVTKDFNREYVPDDADGQVIRVARRFIVTATAGELAIKLGILPYEEGEAFKSCGICFLAWLDDRGSSGSHEMEAALRQIRAFFESHHSSRFAVMESGSNSNDPQKIINEAGYKKKTDDGSYEFYVHTEVFRNEICKGFEPRAVCVELVKQGLLDRGNERQFIKTVRLPIGQKKVYHLKPAILTEETV